MEPAFLPRLRDEDFETTPGALPRSLGLDAGAYLRVVANPFLAFFAVVVWLGVLEWTRMGHAVSVLMFGLAAAWMVPNLFQFHCLDCRATGRLLRWRLHVCPTSAARRREARPRRFRGPSPWTQVLLWLVPTVFFIFVLHVARPAFR